MSTDKTRTSESGARILRVINALRGQTLNGLSNQDLCEALNEKPATINRALNTLIHEGFAVKYENTGRFALSVKMLQIAQSHANEMDRATSRINELQQRVHAGAL